MVTAQCWVTATCLCTKRAYSLLSHPATWQPVTHFLADTNDSMSCICLATDASQYKLNQRSDSHMSRVELLTYCLRKRGDIKDGEIYDSQIVTGYRSEILDKGAES